MRTIQLKQRCTAWIALLAILLSALVPAVGHAFSAGGSGIQWLEVCTVEGVTLERIADEGEPAGFPHLAIEHCPYCFTHAASFALEAPVAFVFRLDERADELPSVVAHISRPGTPWPSFQSRAPPSFATIS